MTGEELNLLLKDTTKTTSIGFRYYLRGNGPIDLLSTPLNTVEDLAKIKRTYRYEGMTFVVLSGSTLDDNNRPIPEEYWLVGGTSDSNWQKKPYITSAELSGYTVNTSSYAGSALTYTDAVEMANSGSTGKIINVVNNQVISGDTYSSGMYIVMGDGVISRIGTTSATGDIQSDLDRLSLLVSNIENFTSALYWEEEDDNGEEGEEEGGETNINQNNGE